MLPSLPIDFKVDGQILEVLVARLYFEPTPHRGTILEGLGQSPRVLGLLQYSLSTIQHNDVRETIERSTRGLRTLQACSIPNSESHINSEPAESHLDVP